MDAGAEKRLNKLFQKKKRRAFASHWQVDEGVHSPYLRSR